MKPDYTRIEDLVTDILDLVYKDMTYQRELLLPDVLHDPVSAGATEDGDTDNVLNNLTEVIKSDLIRLADNLVVLDLFLSMSEAVTAIAHCRMCRAPETCDCSLELAMLSNSYIYHKQTNTATRVFRDMMTED